MSRRSRAGRTARAVKYHRATPPAPTPAAIAVAPPPSLGNRPEGTRLDGDERAPLSDRVLACLATWIRDDGVVVEPTTGDIAARLDIAPLSYPRDELNHALTALRQRGLVKFEHDAETGELRWRLSGDGRNIARSIRTGVTGWERSAAGDRSRDRYAQVMGRIV